MYSVGDYNYFNNCSRARKQKCRKPIPISKPCENKQMKKCKICRKQFLRVQNKQDMDAENKKQSGDNFSENGILVWKYVKNVLFNTVQRNDPQKYSFKIIAHKSYKKRSLHQEIVSTSTSILSQICKICEKRKILKNKCKDVKAKERKINEHVLNEKNKIQRNKLGDKTSLAKDLTSSNEEMQWKEEREKTRPIKLCTRSISKFTNTTALKKIASTEKIIKIKQNPKRAFLPKKTFNTNKKKRMFLKDNRKKVNNFASWQYLQHALSLVGEENITNYVNEDETPVYLTIEEYCLILEAIDTRGSTSDKFSGIAGDMNIEGANEGNDTNTRQLNVSTEDVGTNTDLPIGYTGDAFSNTELLCIFTEPMNETTNELDVITERTNEISEELTDTSEEFDIYTEQLSESTEISDPLSEATEEFDINTDDSSDTIIHFETNDEEPENVNNYIYKEPNENENELCSLVDNEIDQSAIILSEEIEKMVKTNDEGNQSKEQTKCVISNKEICLPEENIDTILVSEGSEQTEESNEEGNESKEQTEPPQDSFDNTVNQPDEIFVNTSSENAAEEGDKFDEN